ncbi:hypothetical protein F2Q69_00030381 [Brassica cretica]|uniref:Uncharacterized protein n=1 Tax=Brassica cretica TaxID=69181 RepID=A0A8S9S7K2_BRACR|nr:hypothetical protein F2Q69_00030381 [Brassica cretica]
MKKMKKEEETLRRHAYHRRRGELAGGKETHTNRSVTEEAQVEESEAKWLEEEEEALKGSVLDAAVVTSPVSNSEGAWWFLAARVISSETVAERGGVKGSRWLWSYMSRFLGFWIFFKSFSSSSGILSSPPVIVEAMKVDTLHAPLWNLFSAIDARRVASSHIALVVPDTSPRLNIEGEADSYDFGVGEGYLCSTKADKLKCLVIDDEGVLHTSHAAEDESLIDRDTKSLIDIHQTTESEKANHELWTNVFSTYPWRTLMIAMNGSKNFFNTHNREDDQPSIDEVVVPSIDSHHDFGQRAYDSERRRIFHWEKNDEYGVYRDEHGFARAPDGRIIHVSREDIRDILKRATMYEETIICLLDHAAKFTRILPDLRSYSKADIDDMVHNIYRASLDDTYRRLDDVYYPLNDIIKRLTTRIDELKEEMDMIRKYNAIRSEASIDSLTRQAR